MDIDMKELEAFSCVVDKRSFSRAAQALYLTQPTVSAHVASLERKLGVKLLVRTTKEIYPSEAGSLLYDYAREILRLRSGAVQTIQALSGRMHGTVTVAASPIPGQYYLPGLIRSFRTSCPDVTFDLRIMDSAEVAEQIAGRKAEIGFTDTALSLPKCICRELVEDRLVIITPNTPRYQALLSADFPVRQLIGEPFIFREEGSRTRGDTEAFLREMGVNLRDINIAVETHSTESIRQMVSEGLGIAVVPKSACEDYCRFGKILFFDFDSVNLCRTLYLVRHKSSMLSPVAQAFFDHAAAACHSTAAT